MAERTRWQVYVVIGASILLAIAAALWLRSPPAPLTSRLVIESANGNHAFQVENAADAEARNRGLQFRDALPPDGGMLFDYLEPRVGVVFWMKDTPISLDIIFISPDGTILRIEPRAEPLSETPLPAGGVIRAVLELNAGTTGRLGIAPGDRIRHAIFGDSP